MGLTSWAPTRGSESRASVTPDKLLRSLRRFPGARRVCAVSFDAASLVEGPRGRYVCLSIAHQLHQPVWSAWLQASWHPSNTRARDALRAVANEVDAAPVRAWSDPLAFVPALDASVSEAMGWQEPHEDDRLTADPSVEEALRPIAAAIAESPAAAWWDSPIDLSGLRCTSRYEERFPATTPSLVGAADALHEWRRDEVTENEDARRNRPDDPRANWSGHWWSTPSTAGVPSTTRRIASVGSVNLLWEEDSMGQRDAIVQPVHPTRTPSVYEIDEPAAWVELVRRYPLDVTWSRRHDWYRVTGRDGPWVIPDWEAVSNDWDAVHLSVLGYLRTATRALPVDHTRATMLAGWDPDQSWWLTDVLTADGEVAERWTTEDADDMLLGWHRTDS
jgi:hypothetical protein